jgi:hypothetical protein
MRKRRINALMSRKEIKAEGSKLKPPQLSVNG